MDKSETLRTMLALKGILLEEARPARKPAPPPTVVYVDRELVRARLVGVGARERDLEWLTASCPSVAAAALYRRPRDLVAKTERRARW